MSLVSHVAIYNVYLNNSMDSDINNKPNFLVADSSWCCFPVLFNFSFFILFAELRCEYRDLAFISLHPLKYLGYHFRYLCLILTTRFVLESIIKKQYQYNAYFPGFPEECDQFTALILRGKFKKQRMGII